MLLKNETFSLKVSKEGIVKSLYLNNDVERMNWVISEDYLQEAGYFSCDKLFGNFEIKVEDKFYTNQNLRPIIMQEAQKISCLYNFGSFSLLVTFDVSEERSLLLDIEFKNEALIPLKIQHFSFWTSFSYIMFRDKNVLRNAQHSAAIFSGISPDYSKIAIMRRSQKNTSLGMYQLKGQTCSVGSYCEFTNRFLEDVSPSLDGLLYHKLILAVDEHFQQNPKDWIYSGKVIEVMPEGSYSWRYSINEINNFNGFQEMGLSLGHPIIDYPPFILRGSPLSIDVSGKTITNVFTRWKDDKGLQNRILNFESNRIIDSLEELGEHQILITFADGSEDQIIMNVMENLAEIVTQRVDYLCNVAFQPADSEMPFAFLPVSNQGESLGKLSLIIKKNLLATPDFEEIKKVEMSVNYYVLPKWFESGDLKKPRDLYGKFYRVMDFEYLAHVLYLLALLPADSLHLQDSDTYLLWAGEILNQRINPSLHHTLREKEEAEMLGVYFLYIEDLISELIKRGFPLGEQLAKLWQNNLFLILEEKQNLKAAMTEHYFDNAGFAPAAAALCNAGYVSEAEGYCDLLLANIGFSNDFRSQNPDRWWESLAYMIHSLWGGVSAAAALDVFLATLNPEYLLASYRAYAAVLYCYDSHSTTTTPLKKGQAASTYAVANPLDNRPDLSHNRFGQEVFAKDGGIFSKIFEPDTQQTSDWDMGEELVGYLDRFGQTAYCFFEGEILHVVNGCYQEEDECYRISSWAPYPKEIKFLKGQHLFSLEGNGREAILPKPSLKKEANL
ncbi:hypothetical protein ACYSNU_15105 [Enterococcus sp. LJL120]